MTTMKSHVTKTSEAAESRYRVSDVSSSPSWEDERDRTFVTMFLSHLVDDVLRSHRCSAGSVDFDGMLTRLQKQTVGKLTSRLPDVKDITVIVHRKLCSEFGSAKDVRDAMLHNGRCFEDAVAAALMKKLHKHGGMFRTLRTFFYKRTSKVHPSSVDSEQYESPDTSVSSGAGPTSMTHS